MGEEKEGERREREARGKILLEDRDYGRRGIAALAGHWGALSATEVPRRANKRPPALGLLGWLHHSSPLAAVAAIAAVDLGPKGQRLKGCPEKKVSRSSGLWLRAPS